MQNSQQTAFWLEAAKIAVPSFIALIVPVLTALWLSKRTEEYKTALAKQMQKEIESFKAELQSGLYEYQTRYSLFQQQRAKAIEELYDLISKTEIALEKVDDFTERMENFNADLKNEKIKAQALDVSREAFETFTELDKYYRSRRIFFDEASCAEIDRVVRFLKEAITRNLNHIGIKIGVVEGFNELVLIGENQSAVKRQLSENKIRLSEMVKNLKPLKTTLETKFRELIDVEKPK
jgi:hypothetical protein